MVDFRSQHEPLRKASAHGKSSDVISLFKIKIFIFIFSIRMSAFINYFILLSFMGLILSSLESDIALNSGSVHPTHFPLMQLFFCLQLYLHRI